MTFRVYRGDNRAPETIAATGFQAWVPLNTETARALIQRALIDPHAALTLPPSEKPIRQALALQTEPEVLGLNTLYQSARNEKSRRTSHVSMSPGEDCGGFGINTEHLYRVELPLPRLYAWDGQGQYGRKLSDTPRSIDALEQIHPVDPVTGGAANRPVLLTDTARIQDAQVIAISTHAEIAFHTAIPADWVTHSRARARVGEPERPWTAMGAAPARGVEAALAPAAATPQVDDSAHAAVPPPLSSRTAPPAATPAPFAHPYQDPSHALHGLYDQAQKGLSRSGEQSTRSPAERSLVAAALADAAHAATPPLRGIDHVATGSNGRVFAIQGQRGDPGSHHCFIDPPSIGARASDAASAQGSPQLAPTRSPSTPAQEAIQDAPRSVAQMTKLFEAMAVDQAGPAGASGPAPRR